MSSELTSLLSSIADTLMFSGFDVSDINWSNMDGDNALHYVVMSGKITDAKLLIDNGIEIDKRGEHGYTPLHLACSVGRQDMVALLVEHEADAHALSQGDAPFAVARMAGHDSICEFLRPYMEGIQSQDPDVWTRKRIEHLQDEIRRLEASCSNSHG